jgi:multiple sugar transport system permease protein
MIRKKVGSKMEARILGYLFTAPSIFLITVLLFIPMANSVYLSFFNTSLNNPAPQFFGFKGYVEVVKDPYTFILLRNALVWTISVAAFQFIFGLGGAVILNKKFYGRMVVRSFAVLPWVIPGIVAAMMWKLFYDVQFGFLNSLLIKIGLGSHYIDWLGTPRLAMGSLIVAAVWKGSGFTLLMMLAALQSVQGELYESSRIDGANIVQQFFYITIPSIKDVIKTTLLLISIFTFNYFEIVWVMTQGGPIKSTHIAPTYIYQLAFRSFNLGQASRYAVLSFIMVSIASIAYVRKIFKTENL